jgi:glycosyltransferase involved in cell wall biosynthesis
LATISIIIPLYNKEQYISRALESVFSQEFEDYEIIVVDDGSTDRGPHIVRQYKDRRLRLFQQDNAGPGAARNKGITISNSPFLAFLDADDEWLPEFLNTSFQMLSSNPNCDAAASCYYLGQERKDITDVFHGYGMTEGPWRLTEDISDFELKHAIYILHSSSTLCKRSMIEKYSGFYCGNSCKYGEDYYLWLQVMLNHIIYRILKPLWWYHLEASELAGKSRALKDLHPFLTDIEPIRQNCPEKNLPLLDRWLTLFALGLAHEYAYAGNKEKARYLINQFPLMKKYILEYSKLKLKIEFPALIPIIKNIKKSISSLNKAIKSPAK